MTPFQATWRPDIEGGALVPLRRFHNLLHAEFGAGEIVTLDRREEISSATRGHYFATLHECWQNLRDEDAQRFLNEEAWRKFLLIKTGYRDERSIVCASKAEAQRVAAFVRPMDPYAVVLVSEAVVRVLTAQSQSARAMDKKRFQESKDKVLAAAYDMLGVALEDRKRLSAPARKEATA